MNTQSKQILEWGVFFASVVIMLDVFLIQIPLLDWFALGIVFLFASLSILVSIVHTAPSHVRKQISTYESGNDLEYLTAVVEGALYGGDPSASRILADEVKSLMLSAIALRTRLSKREVLKRIESDSETRKGIPPDDRMTQFLLAYRQLGENFNQEKLQKTLAEIEGRPL